jgi:cyclophilin family peptidyl-prolyl cis-trans isomerase
VAQFGLASVLLGFLIGGCQRNPLHDDEETEGASANPAQTVALPLDPKLHQSFADATRQDPPADWQRPPDETLSGKSIGKLYTTVVGLWDTIRFQTETGKPIAYSATLETDLGPIEIALRPDLAPNHVRNFLALAQAGYYDGLVFERTVHAKPTEPTEQEVEILEAGCPRGTGEAGVGSLGYWLKAEFNQEPHEAGTIGACHAEDPDTAACRFYITLNKAPFLDGNFTVFGKVTDGLEAARRIFSLPVRNDPEYPEGDRPEKPVVIRKVTIHAQPQ